MSVQSEITRLENAKAAIKAAIEGKGVTVPDATMLDGMAALIESIEAGGGSPFGEKVFCGLYTPASDKSIGSESDALTFSFNENSLDGSLRSFMFFRCSTKNAKWGEVQILSAMQDYSALEINGISGYSTLSTSYGTCSMVIVNSSRSHITFYSSYSSTSLKAGIDYAWVAVCT